MTTSRRFRLGQSAELTIYNAHARVPFALFYHRDMRHWGLVLGICLGVASRCRFFLCVVDVDGLNGWFLSSCYCLGVQVQVPLVLAFGSIQPIYMALYMSL